MFLRVATIAALLLAPLSAQAPAKTTASAALPDARMLIDKHIKAIGGREAILAHTSMHGTGTVSVPKEGMNGQVELFGAAPNLQLIKITVGGIGEISEGFDGKHGWSLNPMTGPTLKVGKELDQVKLDADFYSDLRDPKTFPEVKTVDKVTFDGRPCYKVSLKRIDGSEDFDYYDAATGLRAGVEGTRETQMGAITQVSVESGYKTFGKLMQPTELVTTTKPVSVEQRITLETVEYDTLGPSTFEPPAAIKALIK
jgi:hypothetical protein